MPNINKAVHERLVKMITIEHQKASDKVLDNKRAIKRLVEEQTVLKREKSRLNQLLFEIKPK